VDGEYDCQYPYILPDFNQQQGLILLTPALTLHAAGGTSFTLPDPQEHELGWTTVTQDESLVKHLLRLYFCWEYPIFHTVSGAKFWDSYHTRSPQHCSRLLVNAILSVGCLFGGEYYNGIHGNRKGRLETSDAFYQEALEIYSRNEDLITPTKVQALGVLAIRQAYFGNVMESINLSERAVQMVVQKIVESNPRRLLQPLEPNDEVTDRPYAEVYWGALSLHKYGNVVASVLYMRYEIGF
jgi:hypothetical protein